MGAENVEDIYELSPLQRGMLLHSAYDGAADRYLSQQTYRADGDFDPDALVRAWQATTAAHPALRTSFHWDGLDKPVQVVHRTVVLPVARHDWSGLDETEQRQRLDELRAADAAAGFDLTVAPLQRLTVIRFSADSFGLVWTYHHLLMDGMSIPVFMDDVLGHYRASLTGGPPPPAPPPFRDYMAWLAEQDPEAGKRFWIERLAGVAPNRLIPLLPADPQQATGAVDRRDVQLSASWIQELRAAAARHRVTVATMVQAAWAMVLHRYSDRADVVFGCVSSGRPPALPNVQRVVGVLANTLPVPLVIPDGGDLGTWLREVQREYARMRRYEFAPLADIKKWAGAAGRQLFDSSLSIESYSVAVAAANIAPTVTFRQGGLYDKINYPVAVTITPELGAIQFLAHRQRFPADFIDDALARLRATLEALPVAGRVEDLVAAAGPRVSDAAPSAVAAPAGLDRSADPGDGQRQPVTPLEHAIAEVYREVLGLDEVDVNASFFELGGDSFDAVRAVGRIDSATVGLLAANPSVRDLAQALTPEPSEPSEPSGTSETSEPSATADLDDEIARLEALLERKRAERDGALALVPVPREEAMACSFQQEGMWFMHRLAPYLASYHVPIALRIHGKLDLAALERALHALVVRHEVLRTRFVDEHGLPRQVIEPPPAATSLPVIELRDDQVLDWASELYARPFDLATGPAFRAAVARLSPDDHALVMVFHHIVTDGWSARVLAGELSALYAADRAGGGYDLPPLPVQPADYAAWQRRWLAGPERDRQVGWWRDALTGLSTVDFPADRDRAAQPTGAGSNVSLMVPADVGTAAHAYTRSHHVSLLAVLHAGLLTVLRRYTGQDDLPVGSLLSGRTRSDLEPMVGYFGSIVVLRPELTGDPSFGELVRRCHATVLDATTHQDVPFPLVVDALRPQRVCGRNPLFQIGLTLHPPAIVNARLDLGDVSGQSFEVEEEYALWDIAVDVTDAPDGNLYVSIDYSAELFDADRMRRLGEHFANALAAGLAAPDTPVADVEIMAAGERDSLLEPTGTEAEAAPVEPVHRLVERVAAGTPDAVAVVDSDGTTVSYGQLDEAAERLAKRLRDQGVGSGVPVGIRPQRGSDLVTALLGAWKAGGHPVPLDPDLPPDGGGTSHAPRAVHDQIRRLQAAVPLEPTDRVLHTAPYPLDRSVAELFWPLATGAAVVLGEPDAASVKRLIDRAGVTVLRVGPGVLRSLIEAGGSLHTLRRILCSGPLPDGLVRRFVSLRPAVDLYDVWGYAETFDVAVRRAEPGAPFAPLQTTYVLDDGLRPAPVGVTGQLYVAGSGLAHGYPDRPARTAQRFLPDPYAGRPGARMYATGDLVRRRPDGTLQYVGRRDRRVTVRGERIDLGQVEDMLAEHPQVRHCRVEWRDDCGLTAYLSPRAEGSGPEPRELRRYLADRLPATLVPRRLVVLPALPLTPDGRPDTDTEQWLATTWQELLGLPRVAADDNFFDLGGNSLHATQVVARVRDRLGLDLPVRDLFTHQTLDALAARIAEEPTPSAAGPTDPPTSCLTEQSDSYSVSVGAPPAFVWATLSKVEDWPRFSPFALQVKRLSPTRYEVTSPQGQVILTSNFVEELHLLDHTVTLRDGTEVFIPYRVAPNHRGSELIMTNVKSAGDSIADYEEQLAWMRIELDQARQHVEQRYALVAKADRPQG